MFRRRHLVFVLHLPLAAREGPAAVELDATDRATVEWHDPVRAAGLHLYPAVGSVLAPAAAPATRPVRLSPMTDATYRWR
ncbi:hypothetical protein [Streptomyces sp. NRRL B-24484]|uniref:hypothetical protein n=1 Tax=Streptomyces sp. NRRL B-24484 TaxID=1463833 RepID=UPI0006947C8B|nr:hypothetical protein [Streptomyces sp. NRRL B-24484]